MRILLLTLLVSLHVIGWGQTFKSGTINNKDFYNQYYKVTAIDDAKLFVTVDDPSTLKAFDRVMVIQMTGAKHNSNGTVLDYNSSGNYEITTICRIEEKTVFFAKKLLRDYKPTSGKVQLVKVQEYTDATVNSKIEATPWDSARGTGGVLAISVAGTLTLDANISADTMGFKGGKFLKSEANCLDFWAATANYYDPTDLWSYQSGSYKGESIVNLPMSQRGGRGAVANGGGGGNNHNNGGGGGSNLAEGGIGGGNATTERGACQSAYRGIGGYGLSSNNSERIFLGGGGGSGHGNLVPQKGGGNGGGILFIEAATIVVGSGNKISANGQDGSNTIGDGASGGGAGGSIILSIKNASIVSVEAKGGKGGDEDESENGTNKCYGEGGGGSGGVIYIKGSQPTGTISVVGGAKGERMFTTCPMDDPADKGRDGSLIPISDYAQSSTPNDCSNRSPLPVKLLSFKVNHRGPHATAVWEVSHPEDAAYYILQRKTGNDNWKDVTTILADEKSTTYQKNDGPLATGIYLYRLQIVEKNRSVAYSPIQQITVKIQDVDRLMIHPNPATSEITIVTPVQNEEWLHIYDMKSRLVHRRKVAPNSAQIKQDISFLSEGIYMIRIGKYTARFVVFK